MSKSFLIAAFILLTFSLTSCSDDLCNGAGYQSDDTEESLYLNDLPKDVETKAIFYGKQYDINPIIFLAIAWHERASVYGWYDDYVFGFGAFDTKPWPEKYAGWETQWEYAAPRIGRFFSKNEPSIESFQRFAMDHYKTTAWKSYRTCYLYYVEFGGEV